MSIVDSVLILFLLAGAVLGFKKGAIKSLVALIGLILVVVVSYYIKNPVASFIFKYVPFFQFSGSWQGLVTLNILVYEAISYLVVFLLLSSILALAIKISGILEKIFNATIILGIPSKILGLILGFLEAFVLSFVILFVLLQVNSTHEYISNSKFAILILDKTPVMGTMVNETYQAIEDINALQEKYKNASNKDAYNTEILNILLHYEVVTVEDAQELIDEKKLDFSGAQSIVNTYKED